jgi:hypothetical protein
MQFEWSFSPQYFSFEIRPEPGKIALGGHQRPGPVQGAVVATAENTKRSVIKQALIIVVVVLFLMVCIAAAF